MTHDDILSQRELSNVRIRGDGEAVAFVARRARLAQDDYLSELRLWEAAGDADGYTVAEGSGFGHVQWRASGGELSYWDAAESALMLFDTATRTSRRLDLQALGKGAAPAALEWSPDGARLAVLLSHAAPARTTPYLSDDLSYGRDANRPHEEPQYELAVLTPEGALRCRSGDVRWTRSSGLVWGPQGGVIALNAVVMNAGNGDVGTETIVLDATDCKAISRLPEAAVASFGDSDADLIWVAKPDNIQPDGSFRFSTPENTLMRASGGGTAMPLARAEAAPSSSDPPPKFGPVFFRNGEVFAEVADRSMGSLFTVKGHGLTRAVASDLRLSGCSMDLAGRFAACIAESVTDPPEVGLVDLKQHTLRKLTALNAHFDDVTLGKVERITVPDDRGGQVTMYLVYPTDYQPGRRYPAIMLLYGFNSGFIGQAQYITSYAPQVYAGRGYVTLLWNYPMSEGGKPGDLAAQARDLQLAPFATIQHAADILVSRGLADPARIGIAGHSMGSLWTDYAVAHSDRFTAASSHAPGGYTPSYYWTAPTWWRQRLHHIFGGPPVGATLAAWQALSPPLFAPPRIPQIREVPDKEIVSEFGYRHWRDAGAAVETWVYPDDDHVFQRPRSRLDSLELNLDWFDFWLRHVENDVADKADRYARWRDYRSALK